MIRSIEVIPLRLPIAKELRLARGSVGKPGDGAPHILVKITNNDGLVGWGEARPSPRWSYETPETVVTTLRNYLAPALVGMDEEDTNSIHAIMDTVIAPGVQIGQPIAKSAIDIALYDLVGKKSGISLSVLLGSKPHGSISLGYVISASSIEDARTQTQEGISLGYHGFKIKAGHNPGSDLEMVQEIAGIARGKYLWVDANQGWDISTTIRFSREMAKIGVHLLEQPLAANNVTGYRELVRRSEIPIVLDESIYSCTDLLQFIKLEAINGLVIKLCRVGGIYEAHRMAMMARDAGLLLLGSGLTEGRVSLTASAHVFAAAGIDTPVDLNGSQFLKDDMVAGEFQFPGQTIVIPKGPGLGVEPDPEKIGRYHSNE